MSIYSKTTIQFFNPINIYYNFLSIVPIYSFNSRKLLYCKGYCFWAVTLSLLISLVCSLGFHERNTYISSTNAPNKRIFFVWEAILWLVGYFGVFNIIISSITKRNYWIKLFNNFLAIENNVSWISGTTKHGAKATFGIFVLKVSLNQLMMLITNVIWCKVDPLFFTLYRNIIYFYNTTVVILFGDLTSIVTLKWKVINEILQVSRQIRNPVILIRRIRSCRKLIFEMQIMVDLFNKIFGNILPFVYGYYWARTILLSAAFYQMILTDTYFGQAYTFSYVALYTSNIIWSMVSN